MCHSSEQAGNIVWYKMLRMHNIVFCSAGQGDVTAGRVARSDVAAVCVAALTDPAAKNVTLELSSKKGSPAPVDQLQSIFTGLAKD
jgi:hypothetical protein